MNRFRRVSPLLLVIFLTAIFFTQPVLAGQEQETGGSNVIFLPFSIQAAQDLTYLGEGIRHMLASRLAAQAGIMVNNARTGDLSSDPELGQAVFQSIMQEHGADYLVAGSLIATGGSIRLEAAVHGPGSDPPARFSVVAEEAEVLRAVDQLAGEIGGRMFGLRVPAPPSGQAPGPVAAPEGPRSTPFRTAHPEKAFLGPDSEARRLYAASQEGGGWPAMPAGGFRQSSNFRFSLQALETGDLTGDGNEELVLASRSTVFIYRLVGGRMEEMTSMTVPSPYRVHWLSMADLDGDGSQELYISAASIAEPRSMGFAWDGTKLIPILKPSPWYLRATVLPGEGAVLLGQRHAKETVLAPGIRRLQVAEGSLVEGRSLDLPAWVNIFDFTLADVTGDGGMEIVHIDQADHLVLSRPDGTILWRSSETFGGSRRWLGGPIGATAQQGFYQPGYAEAARYYVPSRLLAADLDGDGGAEVIINRNYAKSVILLGRLRSYASGEVSALSWKGGALTRVWQSRKLEGYVVDYLLQRGEEGNLLHVGVELGGGGLLSNVASNVASNISSNVAYRESTIFTMTLD